MCRWFFLQLHMLFSNWNSDTIRFWWNLIRQLFEKNLSTELRIMMNWISNYLHISIFLSLNTTHFFFFPTNLKVMLHSGNVVLLSLLEPTSFIAVILNGAFLIVNHYNFKQKKDYFLFFCGVSGLNLIFCLSIFTCLPILVGLNINSDNVFCKILGCITVMSGNGAVYTQSILSFNRYLSLYYPHATKRVFTRRNIWLMLAGICLIAPVLCIHLLYFGFIGRMNGTLCAPRMEIMSIGHLCIYMAPMIASYTISIYFTYKVFRLIRNHQLEAANLKSKLQDAKDIVRVIVIEISVPLTLSSPVIILCFLLESVNVPEELFSFALFLFVVHSATDPVIIVLVMKPYREHLIHLWKKFRGENETATVITTIDVRTVGSKL